MTSDEQLLDASKRALRWFSNYQKGNALNGPSDDLIIARELRRVIELVETTQDAEALARELVDRR